MTCRNVNMELEPGHFAGIPGIRGRGLAGKSSATLPANPRPRLSRKGQHMEYVKLGVHIWVSVLIMGTLWRVISYHFIASPNEAVQHLGRAMAQQY
jgi:hypothetical protein